MSFQRSLRAVIVARPYTALRWKPAAIPSNMSMNGRLLSTSGQRLAALASKPTSVQEPQARFTNLLRSPSKKDIEDAELDVELLQPHDAKLRVTDRAAERLRSISTTENDSSLALRIGVESGGCHGYQYSMELTSKTEPEDYVFSHPSIKPSNITVDAVSLPLLKGSTLDFATELIGSSFRINNNPQAKGSGCGCGVSWELKLD